MTRLEYDMREIGDFLSGLAALAVLIVVGVMAYNHFQPAEASAASDYDAGYASGLAACRYEVHNIGQRPARLFGVSDAMAAGWYAGYQACR